MNQYIKTKKSQSTYIKKNIYDNNQIYNNILNIIKNKVAPNISKLIEILFFDFVNKEYGDGYIYCMYNDVFKSYGENVYKIGRAENIENRFKSYCTPYLDDSELKYKSNKTRYDKLTEKLVFNSLSSCRIKKKREFFKCDINLIIKTIDEIVKYVNQFEFLINYYNEGVYTQKIQNYLNNVYKILMTNKSEFEKYIIYNIMPDAKKNLNTKIINADKKNNIIKNILSANDIDTNEYRTIYNKLKSNEATNNDKIKLEKHLLKINWNVNEITQDFMDKFYGKTYVLFNLRWLIDNSKIKPFIDFGNNVSFNKMQILEKIKIIQQLLLKLGYENINDTKKIEKYIFKENMKKVLNECDIFINPQKYKLSPDFKKEKIISIKSFLGLVNTILKEFGVKIKNVRDSNHKEKINGKWKTIGKNIYYINFIDNINDYI